MMIKEERINFIKLLSAVLINGFGDLLFDLYIIWHVIRNNNVMQGVVMMSLSLLIKSLVASLVGIFVDHHRKKKLLIYSNIISMVIVGVFFLINNKISSLFIVGLILMLLNDINNEVYGRSLLVFSSKLFSKDTFVKFESVSTIISRLLAIAGSAVVGFLITYFNASIIYIIDWCTFIVCILLIYFTKFEEEIIKVKSNRGFKEVLVNWKEEFKFIFTSLINNQSIKLFVILMFILNLVYGFIPKMMPMLLANQQNSAVLLGVLKSMMSIGEVVGLSIATLFSKYYNRLFVISMIGNGIIFSIFSVFSNNLFLIILFLLYGILDSLTQPFFSYFVSTIDENNRGKIIGGIDSIILFSPSIGVFICSFIFTKSLLWGSLFCALIFMIALVIFRKNEII